jgi:RNA polymerase primary sigma factor
MNQSHYASINPADVASQAERDVAEAERMDDDTLQRDIEDAVSSESSKRVDDPVRMYLTQMGMIPLLTRDEEIRLAKKIETTRMIFRRRCLECDYIASEAAKILRAGRGGRHAVRPDDADLDGRGEPQGEDRQRIPSNLGRSSPCSTGTRRTGTSSRDRCGRARRRKAAARRSGRGSRTGACA